MWACRYLLWRCFVQGRIAQKQPWILLTHRTNNLGCSDGNHNDDPQLEEGTRLSFQGTHTPSRSSTGRTAVDKVRTVAQAKCTLSLTSTAGNLPVELRRNTLGNACDRSGASEEDVEVLAPCGGVENIIEITGEFGEDRGTGKSNYKRH